MSFCLPESLLPGRNNTCDDDYQQALRLQEQEHDVAHMRQKQREQLSSLDHQLALKIHRNMANNASQSQTQMISDEYYARQLHAEEIKRAEEALSAQEQTAAATAWSCAKLELIPQTARESVTFAAELPFLKYADVRVESEIQGEVTLVVSAVPLPILHVAPRELRLQLSLLGQKGTLSQSDILVCFPSKTTLHVSVLACRLRNIPQLSRQTTPEEFTDIMTAQIPYRQTSFGYEAE